MNLVYFIVLIAAPHYVGGVRSTDLEVVNSTVEKTLDDPVFLRPGHSGRDQISNGDKVYIEISDDGEKTRYRKQKGSLWLAEQPQGTYCAAAGRTSVRAPFIVTFRNNGCIHFEYANGGSYLGQYRHLYGAKTGSVKYDTNGGWQQCWKASETGSKLFYEDEPTRIFNDAYNGAYVYVNRDAKADAYTGGAGKFWVEFYDDKARGISQHDLCWDNCFRFHKVPSDENL